MKTALVLSAGGMFGAYQAGAWKSLAPVFSPDLVVGTSAGSLNGWAIAGGCDPSALIDMWLDPFMARIMRVRWRWSGWQGLWDPAPLEECTRALCKQYQPRIPYFLTLTELARMRARIVPGAEVTWRHLAASCAVPCGFPPVRIDGRLYVDGGLLGALPIWAAIDCGAARALAVDSLPVMPSTVIRTAARLACWVGGSNHPGAAIDVLRITRNRSLGTLREAIHWSADNARRWIEWGEQDGAAAARRLATEHALQLK